MPTRLADLRPILKAPLYRNTFYLMAAAALSYGLGFVFWLVVARNYAEASVGVGVTLLSTILFLASTASLGLGLGLVRFLPGETGKGHLVNYALTLSGVAAVILGIVFLLGVDLWAPSLSFLRSDPRFVAIFLVSLLGFTVGSVMDQAFLAARRADYGAVRMAVYNVLRLPLPIVVLAASGVMGIALAWTAPLLVSIAIGGAVFLPRTVSGYRPAWATRLAVNNEMLPYSLWNHAATIIGGASTALLPLLIVNTLPGDAGATAAAYFFAALAFASLLYVVPGAFSSSLFVEGSHASPAYLADTRRTVRVSLALLGLGIAGAFVLGRWILGLFGPRYAVESYSSFLLLALTSPIVLANSVLMTHLRVDRRLRPLIAVTAASTIVTLAVAYLLLPTIGILGVATGFMAGQALALGLLAVEDRMNTRHVLLPRPA